METSIEFQTRLAAQFQSASLGLLIGGMVIAARGARLQSPNAIYQFIVFMLLMTIGLQGGMEISEADLVAMLIPAVSAVVIGVVAVLPGAVTLARLAGVRRDDALATAGLFGAVSASTLAAGMVRLDEQGIADETRVPALHPFMDIPAPILAIVLAGLVAARRAGKSVEETASRPIIKEALEGSALTARLLGLALGLVTRPERVFAEFYDPPFRGLLSVLMLIMGMEA